MQMHPGRHVARLQLLARTSKTYHRTKPMKTLVIKIVMIRSIGLSMTMKISHTLRFITANVYDHVVNGRKIGALIPNIS